MTHTHHQTPPPKPPSSTNHAFVFDGSNPMYNPETWVKLLTPIAQAVVKTGMGGLRARVLIEPLDKKTKRPMGGVEIAVSLSGIEQTDKASKKKPRKPAPKVKAAR